MSEYRFRFWVPLANFESEVSSIELRDDVTIRSASKSEKEIIGSLKERWYTVSPGQFLLECRIVKQVPESIPGQFLPDGKAHIDKAMSLLRLYKEEAIGYGLIVQPLRDEEPYATTAIPVLHRQLWGDAKGLFGGKYVVGNDEVDALQGFFKEFNKPAIKQLDLAVRYFNKSYNEPYPSDALLDLTICLENLYLPGTRDELAYRLRTRVACVLAKEVDKRKEILADVKKAYNLRSKIVHGRSVPPTDYEFLFKVRAYVRESIKIFARRPALRDEGCLDELILGSSD